MNLKIGDVVQLKSGSPDMTVDHIGGGDSIPAHQVFVVWYEESKVQNANFHMDALKKVREKDEVAN